MKAAITISQLKQTACAARNPHLFEPAPPEKKKRGRPSANVSAALTKLKWDLNIWSKMKGYKLESEYRFHEFRKYRFDWAFPELKIAVEYNGGVFMNGANGHSGHREGSGATRDADKINLAQSDGWKVLVFTTMNAKNVLTDLEKLIK